MGAHPGAIGIPAPLLLLLAAMLAAPADAPAQRFEEVTIEVPAAGASARVAARTGVRYLLRPADVVLRQLSLAGADLVLAFEDLGEVIIAGYRDLQERQEAPRVQVGDLEITGANLDDLLAGFAFGSGDPGDELSLLAPDDFEDLAPAAGGEFMGDGYSGPVPGRRATGYRLLFADEAEPPGLGFHSYLLLQSDAPGGDAEARRRAALGAVFDEVSRLSELLAAGARVAELNVIFTPVRERLAGADQESAARRLLEGPKAARAERVLRVYDFARSRALLAGLGLTGSGPFIVSHPDALLGADAPPDRERLLVQDLSRAPPKLIRSWVQLFKRRLGEERPGLATRLRGFALRVRTELSVLAHGLSITREAVAMTLGEEAIEAQHGAGDPPAGAAPVADSLAASGDAATAELAPAQPVRADPLPPLASLREDRPAARAADPSHADAAIGPVAHGPAPALDESAWPAAALEAAQARARARGTQALLQRLEALTRLRQAEAAAVLWEEFETELQSLAEAVEQRERAGVGSLMDRYALEAMRQEAAARRAELAAEVAGFDAALRFQGGAPDAGGPPVPAQGLPTSAEAAARLAGERHPGVLGRLAELRQYQLTPPHAAPCLPRQGSWDSQSPEATLELLAPLCPPDDRDPAGHRARLAAAGQLLRRTRAAAEAEARRWWQVRLARQARVEALTGAAESITALRDGIAQQFLIGQRSLGTVLETELRLVRVRESLALAHHDLALSDYRLRAAIGVLPGASRAGSP